MKAIIHTIFSLLFFVSISLFATNSNNLLPSIPEHPSISGFHTYGVNNSYVSLRSVSSQQKLKLDSIVVENKEKFVYTYNNLNLNVGLSVYAHTNGVWTPNIKVELVYNNANLLSETVYYSWNTNSSSWKENWKVVYTYNNSGRLTQEIYRLYDVALSQWENSKRYQYTLTNNGVLTKSTHANWEKSSNTWIIDWTTDYVYNINNWRISEISYSIGYVPAVKTDFSYNNIGSVTRKTVFVSNPVTNRWDFSYKIDYLLDGLQRPLVETYSEWNNVAQAWEPTIKNNADLDNSGNLLSLIHYKWNKLEQKWTQTEKKEGAFDANGNPSSLQFFAWNQSSNNWRGTESHTWEYNNNVQLQNLVLPMFYQIQLMGNRQLLKQTHTYADGNSWTPVEERLYFYSNVDINTAIEETSNMLDIIVYPNPSTDYVVIEVPTEVEKVVLTLYNSKGQLVYIQNNVINKEFISLSDLPSGVYLYKVNAGASERSGKIVKQ